ncbi:SRS domain-containing protein [Neospora caninum Liverpool]|uniref:SRS domain-containing protein n=1 Tax=Neospora caninum (strain Liverpool) TaxID=572307 RepID=F0VLB7_NEOCL|nr:SRS domain-containing protein [Neospora caninum Liverpool]CBZ54869.1 SRS domain-containing protein [Neospora caninum Liverpool]CEL69590.1 TPA: SRS domain-containing protein [Neospora caninum Liverpool]|eukprot:XP_003884897.1 SRS domain-containing protein [Neospora caninum Liverpool]
MAIANEGFHVKLSQARYLRRRQQALQSALSVAVFVFSLVSLVSVSAGNPVTCRDRNTFVAVSLASESSSIEFQCPQGSAFFPNISSPAFCTTSVCSATTGLEQSFITLAEVKRTSSADLQRKTTDSKAVSIALKEPQEYSRTLYFLCKKSTEDVSPSTLSAEESQKETTCTLQVSAWGSKNVEVPSENVTFSCGDSMTLSPANFEKAFQGTNCSTEDDLNSLGLPNAALVEGDSATSDRPAYTFSVSSLPQPNPVSICYKCTKGSVNLREVSNECTVRIRVPAAQSDQPGEEEHADGETDGTQTSTEQTSTSGAEILDLRAAVSALYFSCLIGVAAAFA